MVSAITALWERLLISDGVFAPPDVGLGRQLWLRRKWAAQFTVIAVKIVTTPERGHHELRQLPKPIAEGPWLRGRAA
jgi:hypothetical protein